MRYTILAVLTVVGLPLAIAAPVPKEKAAVDLYFPTKTGTKWVMEFGKERAESTITASEEKDGEWSVTLEVVEGGEKRKLERVVSGKGVFGKLPSGKRTQLLEAPPKKGVKWAAEEHFANGQLEIAVVCEILREEKVKVPAGEFEAWWWKKKSSGRARCRARPPCGTPSVME